MEKLSILPAKITIKKCSHKDYWYNDKVGKDFYTEDHSHRDYYVRIDGNLRAFHYPLYATENVYYSVLFRWKRNISYYFILAKAKFDFDDSLTFTLRS